MKFKVGDLVWVKWEDHFHEYTPGWCEYDVDDSPVYCETVGWVIKDTPKRLTLAGTKGHTGHVPVFNGGYSVKVKSCIVKFKVLKGLK